MSLAEFLLNCIADDEALARDAPGLVWHVAVERKGEPGKWVGIGAYLITDDNHDRLDSLSVGKTLARSEGPKPFLVDHATRWDPARVLAECEAKRRIIAELSGDRYTDLGISQETAEHLLELLALPYADRPGYDLAWTP